MTPPFFGLRFALGALVACVALGALAACSSSSSRTAGASSDPSTWQPWHLTSASQLRLGPPPSASSSVTRAELSELLHLQSQRTAEQQAAVAKWNEQPAVIPWTETALQMIVNQRTRPPLAARALAILETGIYDAMIAAYDSRNAYLEQTRPAPWELEPRIEPLLHGGASSYAPAEAAMAGAAERLLTYLFPNEPASRLAALADEAVNSRLWAGANYRSDLERARELGHKVAEVVIAKAEADGSTNKGLPGPQLADEAHWSPTPPAYETPIGGPVGTWRPWLMSSPGQLRDVLSGPSAYGSPSFIDELLEVLRVSETLTPEQRRTAFFWDDGPGTFTPAGHWFEIAIDLVGAFEPSPPQAARAFAYLAAAEADAAIAFFEGKYHWWSIRPVTAMWRLCDGNTRLCTEAECRANPSLCPYQDVWFPIIVTPAFPSYPGGHSTFSGAAGQVLSYFFPGAGNELNRLAEEAADSRLYGGIHFDEDNTAGLVLGRAVADLAVARAEGDE